MLLINKHKIISHSVIIQYFVNNSLFRIAIFISKCTELDDGCLIILKSMTCDICTCHIPQIHIPAMTYVLTYQGSCLFSFDKMHCGLNISCKIDMPLKLLDVVWDSLNPRKRFG